jgi:uracil-DNA glycosylase
MHLSWRKALHEEFSKPYFEKLVAFVQAERAKGEVYPPAGEVWTAFEETPLDQVQVVILGQDPYHGPGQAHGLSFSVKPGVRPPPSLVNIYKELESDLGIPPVKHGYLLAWARRGVFLLNTVMTVRKGAAGSHRGEGWETFTDRVISVLNARETPMVFILWGKDAGNKAGSIDGSRHLVLSSSHPSPMSASSGFFGSKPFSRATAWLQSKGLPGVPWQLPEDALAVPERQEGALPQPPTAQGDDLGDVLAREFG